jgi:two-component system, OmpR family, response regulator
MKGSAAAMKDVYTTGEAARICQISQQTIIRCFDSGRLKGFLVPGSKFRRIPRESLVKFMKENQIPLSNLDTGKKKILIVDDDAEIVDMFVAVLERDGRFEVRTASCGYDAGLLTQQFQPDLIVLDFMLPDINGKVVCETIRSNELLRDTRIIAISGLIEEDKIQELYHVGIDEFIQKPFKITDLVRRIGEMLNV